MISAGKIKRLPVSKESYAPPEGMPIYLFAAEILYRIAFALYILRCVRRVIHRAPGNNTVTIGYMLPYEDRGVNQPFGLDASCCCIINPGTAIEVGGWHRSDTARNFRLTGGDAHGCIPDHHGRTDCDRADYRVKKIAASVPTAAKTTG